MKHAHQHTHEDGAAHIHPHEHDATQDTDHGGADWAAHKTEPHDHDSHGDLDAILDDPRALLDDGGPPLVLVTNSELLRVLEGHEMSFAATDGTGVRVRLYNTGELLADQAAAADDLGHVPGMTREQAAGLCMPLGEALRHARRA